MRTLDVATPTIVSLIVSVAFLLATGVQLYRATVLQLRIEDNLRKSEQLPCELEKNP